MDEARAREIVRSVTGDGELLEALTVLLERRYVEVPFLLRVLQPRPERFIPAALRALSGDAVLDRRTAELVAVAAAASQMCEHCLRVHIEEAFAHGASHDQVLETLLIAARIAESSTNAVSLRVLRRVAGRGQGPGAGDQEGDDLAEQYHDASSHRAGEHRHG
jgi:AhpD family alkylhydroperoxidase